MVEIISKLSISRWKQDVRSFLGSTRYYKRFIERFTKIAFPLFKLLTKSCEFSWNYDCQKAFETSKMKTSKVPILKGHNWKFPFPISIDALDTSRSSVRTKRPHSLCHLL